MSTMGKLRRTKNGIAHWCPACEKVHVFTTDGKNTSGAGWAWNGSVDKPSFTPSMLIRWGKHCDPSWEEMGGVCHYILTDGVINFCGDCTHAMVGQSVPLPDWPYAPGTYGGIEE